MKNTGTVKKNYSGNCIATPVFKYRYMSNHAPEAAMALRVQE